MELVVVGAGVFGLSTALEMRAAGWEVTVVDAGPAPHPEAASTDISKVVRADYGTDTLYVDLMDEAWAGWSAWSSRMPRPLLHRDGFLLLTQRPMVPGDFEHDSFTTLRGRGVAVRRLDGLSEPWRPAAFADGYLNPESGWVESGAVVGWMAEEARRLGVRFVVDRVRHVRDGVAHGVAAHRGDAVVVAAGAWTPRLIPSLAGVLTPRGQPVLHFAAPGRAFDGPSFAAWAGDITRTGWYGFPTTQGVVKVAHHGGGVPWPGEVPDAVVDAARAFLRETLPSLAEAAVVARRVCPYCDSADSHFWVDRLPDDPRVLVASGGSGHGFKFAPVLGRLVRDVLEDRSSAYRARFAWRQVSGARSDGARCDVETAWS
jgi:sarcosine oxidase/L-pipecolate oxidase